MREKWKTIPDTYYEISNLGKVRNMNTQKLLKSYTTPTSNRLYVTVWSKNRKQRIHLNIAREVAKAFLIQTADKNYVNHKDGNKLNNCVDNLEWVTRSENEKHAFRMGLKTPTKGELSGMSKLSWKDIEFIRKYYKPYDPEFNMTSLGKKFNVSRSTIGYIIHNKTWLKE